jgi:predicted amidophosphoribosyltransferase
VLSVVTVCEYVPRPQQPTPAHWATLKFVRALKAEPFNQYAKVPLRGATKYLTMDNRDEALTWAGEMLSTELDRVFGERAQILLVPVPGSKCTTPDHVEASRVYQIATTAASCMFSRSSGRRPMLWWNQEMASAHRGGGQRSSSQLAPHYVIENIRLAQQIVLIDDVLTTGGHLCAAAARLRAAGFDVSDTAFAVARTCWPDSDDNIRKPSETPFSVATVDIVEDGDDPDPYGDHDPFDDDEPPW